MKYKYYNCLDLNTIIFGNGLTSIGNRAFDGCTGLTSVNIPNSVTSLGEGAFQGCKGLTSATIGNGLVSTGDRTFSFCESLVSVTISKGVKSIGFMAFGECYSLSDVHIPNSVTNIGEYAFFNCPSLKSITIPGSVTRIEGDAFGAYNTSEWRFRSYLDSVIVKNPIPPSIEKSTFIFYPEYFGTLYVPTNSKEAYLASAYWNEFENIIEMDMDDVSIRGDINGDGDVSITDVMKLVDAILTGVPQNVDASIYDTNGDGYVTVTDVTLLVNIILSSN